MNAEEFIGLGKKGAQDKAERLNLIFHLVSVDGEKRFGYPEDKRDDRICVELEKNKVIKAALQ